MKRLPFYAFPGLLLATLFFPIEKKEVHLTCNVFNCQKTEVLYLFEFNGVGFTNIQSVNIANDMAEFKIPLTGTPRFYYVGLSATNLRPLILGTEEAVGVESDCNGFRNAKIKVSELNQAYEALKNQMNAFGNETNTLSRQFQQSQGNETALAEVNTKFVELDQRKLDYLEKLKKENAYLAKVFALNTYLSFNNYGKKYPDEIEYFANEFFQLVDWRDPDLAHLPWVFESWKSYTNTLSSINLPDNTHRLYLEKALARIPEKSRTYQLAMGGVVVALKEKNHANFVHFAKSFVEKYKTTAPEAVATISEDLKKMASFVVGGEAPDFSMNQLDGTPLSLSSLRGKVVLIDFWASWCGPCRRENPHVVKLYQEYKDKGFEILGVSLDKTKDNWKNAIDQDGLTWQHVSDLKGWGNEVAQLYGVRSIPHTVLLDKEGKILARGLRSAALEAKLKEIFN